MDDVLIGTDNHGSIFFGLLRQLKVIVFGEIRTTGVTFSIDRESFDIFERASSIITKNFEFAGWIISPHRPWTLSKNEIVFSLNEEKMFSPSYLSWEIPVTRTEIRGFHGCGFFFTFLEQCFCSQCSIHDMPERYFLHNI